MKKASFAALVTCASLALASLTAACTVSTEPDGDPADRSSAALTTADGGSADPADKSTLGAPSLVGASPVQPSPWDHLISGASK